MSVLTEEYHHPSQATRVKLVVYEQPQGFLVAEERVGSATVVRTIGLVATREAALELARLRAESLTRQRWVRVPPAAA